MSKLFVVSTLFLFGFMNPLFAVEKETFFQSSVSFLNYDQFKKGAEVSLGVFFQPTKRNVTFGPKVTVLKGNGLSPLVLVGGEGTAWMMNAFGFSVSFYSVHFSKRWRLDPVLKIRFLRFREKGAWSVHVGGLYDSQQRWGAQIGLGWQPSGIL